MAENGEEKTEDPTPRRRQEAREDGNIARSSDLSASLSLLASIVLLHWVGMHLFEAMERAVTVMLAARQAVNPTRPSDLMGIASFTGYVLSDGLLPIILTIAAVGVLATLAQVGFIVTGKPLTPSFSKLSLIKGAKNLVNLRAGVRLVMSLGKIAILAAVAVVSIVHDLPWIMHMGRLQVAPAFTVGCQMFYSLALKLAGVLVLLAVFDYAYQRWQHQQDLRMTKQEVKEEMKRMEGDPMIKQRRSRVARQLAMQRMTAAVPQADVIVTNPTHFSVALKYDAATMRAPKLIAKGADLLAMRIRQIAATHQIPIVERKPLARALYHNIEVGQEIPPEHYAAVAEILAYVYRVTGTRKSA